MTDAATRSKLITPRALAKALADAGIIPDPLNVHRIVIRADATDPFVSIEVECFGDERLLGIVATLDGNGG